MINEAIVIVGKSSYALSIIQDILFLNGASNAAVVANIPDEENESLQYKYKIDGFLLNDYNMDSLRSIANKKLILGSIGKARLKIYNELIEIIDTNVNSFLNVIHPSAIIGADATQGHGVHISPNSVVAPFASIGDFCVLNRNVSIGHHTILENFVTINPGVNIAGMCRIGFNTIIGVGTSIMDGVSIGSNSIIGAGSVVTKNIPNNVVAYGIPAKVIKVNH
jgi:sugar O-acyltransferase (sialic acid O-acetyltransferase NeuD family)